MRTARGAESTSPADAASLESVFRCPSCAASLRLAWSEGGPRCALCGWAAGDSDGVLDFARDPLRADERGHYEAEYSAEAPVHLASRRPRDVSERWTHPAKSGNSALLSELGDLEGKVVLLLGNGRSEKEMFFLTQRPALLVFSDLAAAGLARVARNFELREESGRVCFAAIDALALPMADGTVDVVYGNAIVHHLPDMDRCLAEAARVLKPGGRAVFMDAAYAPLWQSAKRTLLRPLMWLSHRLHPRSPEDRRYTMEGGFRESELGPKIRALGGEPFFRRHGFLFYLWQRGARSLLPASLAGVGEQPAIARLLARLDEGLAVRFEVVRRNQVRLVWGFTKAGRRDA